jgi:arabinogalactan endo-1,4-beta-galactosidase
LHTVLLRVRRSGLLPAVLLLGAVGAVLCPPPARAAAAPDGTGLVIGADLSFLPQEESHGAVFRDGAGFGDAIEILERHGLDYGRLRLWHSPADGHSGLVEVLGMARRLRARGLGLLLDLHYSDTWADPGHQRVPAAWAGLSSAVLEDSAYRYTRDVVAALAAQGTPPDMVQLGNEITSGLLWDQGRVGGSFDTPQRWRELGALLKATARGVRQSAPAARIMLHIDRGGDAAASRWFFDHVVAEGVPFDAIGLSYYPWWHGSLERLSQNLAALADRYGRDLFVVETSYPWTLDALDGERNLVGLPGQLLPGYAATPAGQAAFLRRLAGVVGATPKGHGCGVFVWAPDWIAAPGMGSSGENLALFDGRGNLLPAADALAATKGRPVRRR